MNHPAFKAKIFVPSKGIDWRINSSKLIYGGYFFLLLTLLLAGMEAFSTSADNLIKLCGFFMLGIILFGSYLGANEKEKKYGVLDGELEFGLDGINFGDVTYSWNEVSNFKLGLFAVLDEMLWSETYFITRYYGGPAYSQGVDNFIEFTSANKKVKVFFQLETPAHKAELRRMMRLLFFHDRIDLTTTYLGLNLEYEEIQELKKAKIEFLEGQRCL